MNDIDARIQGLRDENAALRARLEKAVVLPCKPHEFVWYFNVDGDLRQAKYLSSFMAGPEGFETATHILYVGNRPFDMIMTDAIYSDRAQAEAARSPDMRPIPDLPNGEYADDGRNHYGAAQEGGEGVEADG